MILGSRMVDDVEHLRVAFESEEDVREWVAHVNHAGDSDRYIPGSWNPKELFGKSSLEIIEFIEDRFRNTTDVQEYYACMLFLKYTVPEDELYVLWKDSPNYQQLNTPSSTGEHPPSIPSKTTNRLVNRRSSNAKNMSRRRK